MDKEEIQPDSKENREIASHIFNGSITMIGICITVIALFRIMKINLQTYADEILAIDTVVFIASSLFSYSALRKKDNARMERVADYLFYTGMFVMLVVGGLIVFNA